jgi:hypothetical protein
MLSCRADQQDFLMGILHSVSLFYRHSLLALALAVVVALGHSATVQTAGSSASTSTGALATAASIGGGISVIAVDGAVAYIAEAGALTILDIHDPDHPALRARLPLHEAIIGLQVAGGRAYALDQSTLSVVDVHAPARPFVLSTYPLYTFSAGNLQIVGSLLYISEQGYLPGSAYYFSGIEIVDVSDPYHPVRRNLYGGVRWFTTLQVIGTRAYLAVPSVGLRILDVSDPAGPVLLGGADIFGITDVRVAGTLAYVTESSRSATLMLRRYLAAWRCPINPRARLKLPVGWPISLAAH